MKFYEALKAMQDGWVVSNKNSLRDTITYYKIQGGRIFVMGVNTSGSIIQDWTEQDELRGFSPMKEGYDCHCKNSINNYAERSLTLCAPFQGVSGRIVAIDCESRN